MKAIKYIFTLAATLMVFNSCTKQVAGPQGPQGAQGAQGPSATYYVTIDSIPKTSWSSSGGVYIATINNVQGLTSPNYAIVDVYCSNIFNSLSTWFSLPQPNIAALGNASLAYYYLTNKVVIECTPQPAQELYFKVVVMQP